MNPDSPVGRILTVDEAIAYYERIIEAEKAMGPLSREEKIVVLSKFGTGISLEELVDMMQAKRVLIVQDKKTETFHNAGPEHWCNECCPNGRPKGDKK